MAKALKTLRGYTAHAQMLAECQEDPVGYIPRQTDIASPYRYSPTEVVYSWNGHMVFIKEVAHRKYEVHKVPANETITTDAAATDIYIARTK
jgi:hypothetical protein